MPLVNIWCWFSRTKNLLFWTCCHWLISTNTEQREGFCVRQSLRLLRGLAARGMCGTDSLQTQLLPRFFSPNAFISPGANPLIHCATSCSQGFLCDIHPVKVTRRRNQISVVHGMEKKKERVLCLWLCSACPLPRPTHPRAAALCPSPGSCCVQLPLLPLSPGSLWMVGQISALPHQCALGLWSRCCLALAGRILMKSCIRGISLEVFSFCSQSFLCCRILRLPPSKFNVNYLFLIQTVPHPDPLPMTLFPWEAAPAGAHSAVLSTPPCTGRFPSVKPSLPLWQLWSIFFAVYFVGAAFLSCLHLRKTTCDLHDQKVLLLQNLTKSKEWLCSNCTWTQRRQILVCRTHQQPPVAASHVSFAPTNEVCLPWNAAIWKFQ